MIRLGLKARAFFALAVCVFLPGCEPSNEKAVYPVKGQLFVRSQPAEGALIILSPADGADPSGWTAGYPRAVASADGSFQISTYEDNDGAPAGEYIVLVQWRKPVSGSMPSDPETEVPDRLGGRYMDPQASKLRATVSESPTELPRIDLE